MDASSSTMGVMRRTLVPLARARRDLGLVALSAAGVGAAYLAASDSLPLATGAVIAASTATGMHGRLAMGRWRAAALVVASGVLLAVLGAAPRLVGVQLITALAGAELMARRPRRSAVLQISALVAAIAGIASLSGVAAAVALPSRIALTEGLAAAIGGFLSAPLMLTLAPLAEGLFGHITHLTMSEWLSYEHPLLRQLASAAPGTFQHSVNVGVLTDAAARAIGADPLLARLGGLYHDVGKMKAPEFFIENQHGPNPHDGLDPGESARMLRAHVFDGVELVERHRMGPRIADFVRQHHGEGEMRLLREKAEALGRPFEDDAFRYPGPRPRTREAGLLMIADQVEATARATVPADDATCDAIVRDAIDRIRREGQLVDSGLSDADLDAAGRALSRALQAMYHRRVSYPSSGAGAAGPRLVFPRRPRRSIAS